MTPLILIYEHVINQSRSGAQIVFHSFLQPVAGRFFSNSGPSSNLRAQAEAASKPHST